ncbi:MAG: 23S rRNA (pseudouridine(1915)-N(3))-methyltransferase RlmH [Ruminococcaceae bacterium]|nr:23S rRNA (pseudouridine(1915)-N(3))-methyltransferase RlmH [Oscillospiraceae bacterium]
MATIKIITVGTLKEKYLCDAVAEYEKRLSGFCKIENVNIKESKLPAEPSQGDIKRALDEEGKIILSHMSDRAYKIALCVEGKQFSSEELASKIEHAFSVSNEICLVIGSSHGLCDAVKNTADLRLSVSKLTFPHQLMRVILLESIYRAMNIIKGTKYHK